jgi:hypothetical protein
MTSDPGMDYLTVVLKVPSTDTAALSEYRASPRTLMIGGDSLIQANIVGSKEQQRIDEAIDYLREVVPEFQRQVAEFVRMEAAQEAALANVRADVRQVIDDFCDYFSELKAEREAERRRIAAEEASRAELRAAMDALPDPGGDPPVGAYPDPSLQPDPRLEDPEGEYRHYPDGPEPRMGEKPAELPTDSPDADEFEPDLDLPEGMGVAGIPGLGTMPKDPENLAHPQPYKQTPMAIGGP